MKTCDRNIIIIITIILIIILCSMKLNENFFIKNDGDNVIVKLKKRIHNYQIYPHDDVKALRPIGITDNVCDICVYKDNIGNMKYGDFIKKPINQECPVGTEYMSRCVYYEKK